MILKMKRPGLRSLGERRGGCFVRQFNLIMNHDTIVFHGHPGIFRFLACVIEFCRMVFDVIRLPAQGREAHVDVRFADCVNAATLIVFTR